MHFPPAPISKNKRLCALTRPFYHVFWEFCKKSANIFSRKSPCEAAWSEKGFGGAGGCGGFLGSPCLGEKAALARTHSKTCGVAMAGRERDSVMECGTI